MRVVIIGLVFAAIMLAGGTAYLLRDYLSAQQAEFAAQAPKAPTLKILVASKDLSTGTIVNADNTQWLDWPENGLQDTYLLQSKNAKIHTALKKKRHIARRAFSKGEPITMARLYKSGDLGFLRGALGSGMRAIAMRSGAENSASGFVLPGDRVDVMLTHSMLATAIQREGPKAVAKYKGGLQYTSETILENIRVLAIDQNMNEFQDGAQVGKTVLLEVSPKNAEKLQTAKVMGQLSLVLRASRGTSKDKKRMKFTTDVEVSPLLSNLSQLINGPKKKTTSKRAPAPRPVNRAAPVPKQLTIYRGTTGTTGNATP